MPADPIESPEAFAERVRDAWVHDEGSLADVITSLIRARDSAVGAFAIERRDRDWILAMAEALGTGSGFNVPITPETEPFRALFAAVRREALLEAARIVGRFVPNEPTHRTDVSNALAEYEREILALAESEEPNG